jgi:hypothetical protein
MVWQSPRVADHRLVVARLLNRQRRLVRDRNRERKVLFRELRNRLFLSLGHQPFGIGDRIEEQHAVRFVAAFHRYADHFPDVESRDAVASCEAGIAAASEIIHPAFVRTQSMIVRLTVIFSGG